MDTGGLLRCSHIRQFRQCRVSLNKEQKPEIPLNWDWVETSVWTKRMLAALGNGVKGGKYKFFAERGLFTMHEAHISASQSR